MNVLKEYLKAYNNLGSLKKKIEDFKINLGYNNVKSQSSKKLTNLLEYLAKKSDEMSPNKVFEGITAYEDAENNDNRFEKVIGDYDMEIDYESYANYAIYIDSDEIVLYRELIIENDSSLFGDETVNIEKYIFKIDNNGEVV